MGARTAGKGGFSLVEVLVACALLALALVPLMRAARANASLAQRVREEAAGAVGRGDAAARERLEAGLRDGKTPSADLGKTP